MKVLELCERIYSKRGRIEKKISALEKELDRLQGELRETGDWRYAVHVLAKKLSIDAGATSFDAGGPQGICARMWITLDRDLPTEKYLPVVPQIIDGGFRLKVTDYSKVVREFQPDSIGALNGMQYDEIDISDMEIKEVLDLFTRKECPS